MDITNIGSPWIIMLCGVPASGKSTWIKNMNLAAVVISTDDFIETYANQIGKTYDDVFESIIGAATDNLNIALHQAFDNNQNIIWDQTNVGANTRAKKLRKIPIHYKKVAVVFETPNQDVLEQRLANRPGKTIPKHIMTSMIQNFQLPTLNEGFDSVVYAQNLHDPIDVKQCNEWIRTHSYSEGK